MKLMGFTQTDVDLLRMSGLSNSRIYKMAGTSIVVDVAMVLMRSVLKTEGTPQVNAIQ